MSPYLQDAQLVVDETIIMNGEYEYDITAEDEEAYADEHTDMVAPMTTSSEELPSRVECQFEGLKGYIMVDQIRAVEKFCFIKKLGKLELGVQVNLCDCLQEFFAL